MIGMRYPLRENLEVGEIDGRAKIRCARCSHVFCRLGEDWRRASKRRLLPAIRGGPLMKELEGRFFLEQLYCPGCGALLNTEFVEGAEDGK